MNWSIPNEIIASLIASAIIFLAAKLYNKLRRRPVEPAQIPRPTTRDINELLGDTPLKITSVNIRDIRISGTAASLTVRCGGPLTNDAIRISGTGATQTVYVSKDNRFNIRISGTGATLRIDNSLKSSVSNIRISGTGAEVKWI